MELKIEGLDTFEAKCRYMLLRYPDEVTKLMQDESRKGIKEAKSSTPHKSFKSGYITKTSKRAFIETWKMIKNKKPHLHLVNDGHEIWSHGVDTGKRYTGQHFLERIRERIGEIFNKDVKEWVEEMLNGLK